MSIIKHALDYAREGYKVFPCKRNKKPLTPNGFKSATTDLSQVDAWWKENPWASIGMPTGPTNNIWVLDVDCPVGPATLDRLIRTYGPLPTTREQRTGGGGFQLFFRWPAGLDIRNSAAALGPGLDVRGNGGYVIVPPSGHPSGGTYRWASDTPILYAPEWILNLIAKGKEHAPPPGGKMILRECSSYGQAALAAELGRLAIAAPGERNHTLNRASFALGQLVAGGELSEQEVLTGLSDAAARCGLSEKETQLTIQSGFLKGQMEPRAAPDDRPEVNRLQSAHTTSRPIPKRRIKFSSFAELATQPQAVDWVIRGILENDSLAVLFGESGTMKSFMAIDWGMSIATGLLWNDQNIKQGPVFYVAGEGQRGIRYRLRAWALDKDINENESVPFFVSGQGTQFLDPYQAHQMMDAINDMVEIHGSPRLLIIDTLSRCFGPGDENSNTDMAAFVAAMDTIKADLACSILIVHHSGLADKDRSRGASALRAALDFEYQIKRSGDAITLTCKKSKDHEEPEPMSFEPDIIPLGWTDEESGDELTSVVLRKTDRPMEIKKPLQGANKIAYDALVECINKRRNITGTVPDGVRISRQEWRDKALSLGLTHSDEKEAQKKAFQRAVTALKNRGYVDVENLNYWIK